MIFVFYPVSTTPPNQYLNDDQPVEYVPVNPDGSVTESVTMQKGDRFYVIHDQSPMDKLIKSFKPSKLGRSQLRGHW